jgi:hypothetical protein
MSPQTTGLENSFKTRLTKVKDNKHSVRYENNADAILVNTLYVLNKGVDTGPISFEMKPSGSSKNYFTFEPTDDSGVITSLYIKKRLWAKPPEKITVFVNATSNEVELIVSW